MNMKSGFFNSIGGDRIYSADFFADYFASFIGNGVFPEPSDGLQVIANDDMSVTVRPGKLWIDGYILVNNSDAILSLEVADGSLSRIDRVVARLDVADRSITIRVKEGVFAGEPAAKELQRDADAWELALADICISKGAISVTQSDITDTRLNDELCGIVHGVVEQVDTTTLFNQYEAWYQETTGRAEADIEDIQFNFIRDWNNWYDTKTAGWESDFNAWFDRIKPSLEGDVAENLAQQIIEINDRLDDFAEGINKFKVGNTEGFKAVSRGSLKIEISFGDPRDSVVTDENGDTVTLAEWKGTMVRGKLNSYPIDPSDGQLIFDNKERDQYRDTPFSFEYLKDGDKWYFMAFPYTEKDVHTIDSANRDTATALDKLPQLAPPAPTISGLEFDRVTVSGGDLVSLDKNTWHNSPHVFAGLVEETTYTAYAKKKETPDYLESPISEGQTFTTPAERKIYGVEIDESNSNPETSVTYTDDAVGFTPMAGNNGNHQWGSWESIFNELNIKPCLVKNGTVNYYLNPNDYTKKADGSVSDITSGNDGDVMVEFPKLYWKMEKLGTRQHVKWSVKPFPGAECPAHTVGSVEKDKIYLSAYMGHNLSGKLRSLSGKTPTARQTIGAFRSQAQANGSGYQQMSYYPLLMLQVLYITFYKSRDSQTALGRGYVDGNSSTTTTGATNKKGMFYGETTGKQQNKFCGVEDFWGNVFYWIDGFYSDSNRNLMISKQDVFNDNGSGYVNHGQGATANFGGYIGAIQGGTNTGFVIKSSNGSATTHYADYGYLIGGCLPRFGGSCTDGSYAGAFLLNVNDSASHSHAYLGARVCFMGN